MFGRKYKLVATQSVIRLVDIKNPERYFYAHIQYWENPKGRRKVKTSHYVLDSEPMVVRWLNGGELHREAVRT